ncbi:MAG TPA: dihydroorotase, partial [Methanothrix sp.]|nr:dihydroorotase [Methanothrix sp.]
MVKNGRVFTANGQMSTEVWIKDGRIAALGGAHRAEESIDARGMLVLPGAIDAHVHFRDPGPNYKEDWASGSASAAAGGVTAVIDQPNTVPRTMDARSFEEKLEIARHRSCIDFALNGGPGKIDELKEAGAQAIGEIFSYEHSDAELAAILSQVGRAGMLASLHAEDGAIIKEKAAELSGRHDPEVYSLSRPASAEALAIEKACGISERLHICHLSSAQGLAAVEEGRRAGRAVTAEVAPHHLLLNEKDYPKQGSFLKMNPPLRRKADNDALWQALRSGKIDILASDHAPHLPEEKREDIWEAPPGVPGVETMLPLMLMAVKKNHISLERLVDALSARPAKIFGLARKGAIERGMDA